MTNTEVMQHLLAHARKLDHEGGALFQVRAFRSAAIIIQGLPQPVESILAEKGRAGLETIPGVGKSIAYAVEQLLGSGELRVLRSPHLPPREQLRSLPGVGHRTAERFQDEQGVASVSDLRRAGRLVDMRQGMENEPPLSEILTAEADFRRLAGAGVLGRAAPRAYSPSGPKWEGVLHCQRAGWNLRVAWADTALAHRLGKNRDWVEVRFDRDGVSGVRTIVTEDGRRVVRGREHEGCGTAA